MLQVLASLVKDESGVTAVEYALIAALIAVAAITVMQTTDSNMSKTFSTVAELLHADDEIVESQHDTAHPRNLGHLIEHAGHRGVGADQHPVGCRALEIPGELAPVGCRVGVLVRVVLALRIA